MTTAQRHMVGLSRRLLLIAMSVLLGVATGVSPAAGQTAVAPVVSAAIPDTTVAEDAGPVVGYRDLNTVFSDVEDGDSLAFTVASNSNPGLVTATIDADSAVGLSFAADGFGSATIVIRATDSELLSVADTFVVTVTAVNDPPYVATAIPDLEVHENAAPVADYQDLRTVFGDVEDGAALTFVVQSNSDPALVTVAIDADSLLDLSFAPDDEGTATIVIRAIDGSGAWVDESFAVWVHRTLWRIHADGSGQRPDIQSALNATVGGDTVLLSPGVYSGGGNRGLSFGGKAVLLTSTAGADSTLIDSAGDRFADLSSGEGPGTVIDGITVMNGNKVIGGTFKMSGSSPTVRNVVIVGGSSNRGGAIYCDAGAAPTITNCTMVGNAADEGGAIHINAASATIENCTLVQNSATIGGAGIHLRAGATATITSTIVAFSTLGPGMSCEAGTDPVVSCSNLFGNAGGDSLCGTDAGGNISADPDFCTDPSTGAVSISATSPCAPANNGCGVLIGAGPIACGPPEVVSALPDTTVDIGIGTIAKYRDLNDVFYDDEDGSALAFAVVANSNPALVVAVIDADSALGLVFDPTVSGIATITVRATDSEARFVEDAMTVNVIGGTVTFVATHDGGTTLRPGAASRSIYRLTVVSSSAVAETLTAVTFANATTGPGNPSQLDGDLTELLLRADDGGTIVPGGASGGVSAVLSGGTVTFSGLELVLNPGGWRELVVEAGASLAARDGDVVDLAIPDSLAVAVSPPADISGRWPLRSGAGYPVDGMTAAQAAVNPLSAATFPTGSTRNLALDITLPANGYQADVLNRINVQNLGTGRAGSDIARMDAWADDGDGTFDPDLDPWLGRFSYTGSRWELTGLSQPVPLAGVRVFVSVDVATLGGEGRTVRLAVPAAPDLGVGMDSGNDGPLDAALAQPAAHSIASSAAMVLSAAALAPGTVFPGTGDVPVLQLVATNNTGEERTLSRLTVTNATIAQGGATQADADAEVQTVALRVDGNDNGILDDSGTDPVAASSFFSGGVVTFTGLTWTIPAAQSRHLFVTADVSPVDARDGDVIAAVIGDGFDVDFTTPTVVVADYPVTSDAAWTIDGMLAAQITNLGGSSATLAPGDGPALAFDFIVPSNGYADDILDGIELINQGSATSADMADVRVWLDGGDGVFTPGTGDDTELGPMVWTGSSWRSPLLTEPVVYPGVRCFVGVTVAPTPVDSASIHFRLPTGGVSMASGNDGPIDEPVVSTHSLLVSTSPLLATMDVSPAASTIGQAVTVRMIVRNVGGEQVNGIAPSALTVAGDASLTPVAGPQPPSFTLAPAAVDTFTWTYSAGATGVAAWTGSCQGIGAVSGLTRIALAAESPQHQVFAQAGNLSMVPIATMPLQINRGQADVVPLSLSFTGTGGASASNTRILGLRVRIEAGNGSGVVPADLLSRVSVGEGTATYVSRTSLESSGAEVDLTFATPALVRAGEQTTLAIRMDIDPATVVPEFRVVVVDSSWISAVDAVSGAPVGATLDVPPYPVSTGVGRITDSPTQLDVAATATSDCRAGRGQTAVPLMQLTLGNPGTAGLTADIDVAGVAVSVTDTNGVVVPAAGYVFDRIRVTGPNGILTEKAWGDTDSVLALSFAPPASVPVNTPVQVAFEGDVASDATLGSYRLRLVDAASVYARDANSGAPLPVNFGSAVVAGHTVGVEAIADSMLAEGTAGFPPALTVGQTDVHALTTTVRHPGGAGEARIEMNAMTLHFQNAQRDPVVPASVVDRVRLLADGNEVAAVTSVPASGDAVTLPLPALVLSPGASMQFDVYVDISAGAPQSFVEVIVDGGGLNAVDANVLAPVVLAPAAGTLLPITSGLTQLVAPATELEVSLDDRMPAVLSAGASDVGVAALTLDNTAAPGSGSITVERLTLRAADADESALALGLVATSVSLYAGSTLLGQSAVLGPDSSTASVVFSSPIDVDAGVPLEIEVRVDLRPGPGAPGFRIGIDESGVGVQQPGSVLLMVDVVAPPGRTFPLWTETGNFTAMTLEGSFSNFPNPFAAGNRVTTFVYYLSSDADVSLRLFTLRGDAVVTLLGTEHRSAGLHQSDVWDGRNGRGVVVQNGVYVAELEVRYADGASRRLLRKVAVLR